MESDSSRATQLTETTDTKKSSGRKNQKKSEKNKVGPRVAPNSDFSKTDEKDMIFQGQIIDQIVDQVKIAEPLEAIVDTLKTEWSLFWDSLLGDHEQDPFDSSEVQKLSLDQLKEISKSLSSEKKKINLELEKINKSIEASTTKLENLKLVYGDLEETLDNLQMLSSEGDLLNQKLQRLDSRIQKAREYKRHLSLKEKDSN